MEENKKMFADYPEVSEAVSATKKKSGDRLLTNIKKHSKKIKVQKKVWRSINEQNKLLKFKNKCLKKENKCLKKKIRNFEEKSTQSDKNQERVKYDNKDNKNKKSEKKVDFPFKKAVDTVLRAIKVVTSFLNAVIPLFSIYTRSKMQRGAMA